MLFGLLMALLITPTVITAIDRRRKLAALQAFAFPDYLAGGARAHYPQLSDADWAMVLQGLRDYFAIAIDAQGRRISMPSRVVDAVWHQFILSTRAYQEFCRRVLGRFLHHTPAEAMTSPTHAQEGIRRAWRIACAREGIDPKRPDRLPRLFALDAQLAIPGGFTYVLDCRGRGAGVYCAGDIGCSGSGGWGSGGCGGDSDGGGCGGD